MIKKLLCFVLVIPFIFVSKASLAQGSDFQCTPTDLGLLPFAGPCASSSGFTFSTAVIQTGTTLGSGNDSLSGWITSCHDGTPLHDVWYSFNASEPHVKIDIQGIGGTPLTNSYVALYESFEGECVGIIPRACDAAVGSGLHTMEFGPLTLGVKYYIQIASTLPTGDGAFSLSVKSKNICSDCSRASILNAYPLPVAAAYPPDTTVFFCYTVVGYNEVFGNRLHGMVPLLGSGWDATTLGPIDAPDSVDLAGQWKWYNGLFVPGSGPVTGFFYDVGGDNIPGNNLGDHGSFLSSWTFCFKVKTQSVAACNASMTDLSIRFLNFADGESGSLVTSYDCSGDVDYVLDAHMECCPKPSGIIGQAAGCNSTPDGSIYVLAGFSVFGYEYFLYDATGNQVATHTAPAFTPYTFTGLLPGNYYLLFNENTGSACMTGYNVYVPGPLEFDITQTSFNCSGSSACTNDAIVTVVSGSISSITWSPSGETGLFATSLCTGWNKVTIVDTGSVACTIVDSIFIVNQPSANPYFDYSQATYCSGDSMIYVTDFPVAGGGTFSMGSLFYPVGFNPATDLNPSTGALDISGVTSGGYLIIKYTTPPPCSNFYIDTMYMNVTKPMPTVTMFPDQTLCTGDSVAPYVNGLTPTHVLWFSDSLLTTMIFDQAPGVSYNAVSGPVSTPTSFNFYLATLDASGSCLSDPLTLSIDVYPAPNLTISSPLTICPGFGVNLNATGASTYLWSPASDLNNATLQGPSATPNSTTLYTVVGTTAYGCSATDSVLVTVDGNGPCELITYSGFTPNGDDHNDFWFIDGISVDPENEVYIFNRWGDKVWQAKGYNNRDVRWEGTSYRGGKPVPAGTYFYIIKYKGEDTSGYIELTK